MRSNEPGGLKPVEGATPHVATEGQLLRASSACIGGSVDPDFIASKSELLVTLLKIWLRR